MSRHSSKTLEQRIIEKIKWGESKEKIIADLGNSQYAEDLGFDEVKREIIQIVDTFPNYDLIQQVMTGCIVKEINSRSLYIVNTKSRTIQETTLEELGQIFNSKMDLSKKRYTCNFEYNPKKMAQLYKSANGIWTFNTYRPPFWQADAFYDGKPLVKVDKISPLYEKYFMHLVDGDIPSYEYMLDWTAFTLQDRNFCILTTIGTSGVGKGKFGEILEVMFGDSNFTKTGNNLLTKDFNAQVAQKLLVYINEASVKDQSQEERVKALVDFSIEIEKKGKDAYNAYNYANFYFSSNFLDSIRIPEKDRRFSIINLTDKQLQDVLTLEEIDALLDPKNVSELARYLLFRPVQKRNMIRPFKSARTEEVRNAGLLAWQEWFLDEYCIDNAGKTIKFNKITEDITEEFGMKYRPSKGSLKLLQSNYPQKFKICKPTVDGKQILCIEFPIIEKTPTINTQPELLSKNTH